MSVEAIRSGLIGVPHGFLGRRGGVSEGLCAGLNVGLGSGDERAAIAENRRRAVEAVAPGARLVGFPAARDGARVRVGAGQAARGARRRRRRRPPGAGRSLAFAEGKRRAPCCRYQFSRARLARSGCRA